MSGTRADSGSGCVRVRHENAVAWITLDRPDRLNAFAGSMRDDLADAVASATEHSGCRVLVITGAGRAFSAGADVAVMAEMVRENDRDGFAALVGAGMRVVNALRSAPQPVVAAVNGVAAGAGASLAAACDLRIASDAARIGFTFNRIGLHPDWGATFFLPRLVGTGRAAELMLTARLVEADEAERIGLFERVVTAESFQGEVEALAAQLADGPPLALARFKRTVRGGAEEELDEALRREAEAQLACFDTADVREGIAAFHEKRAPAFRGE